MELAGNIESEPEAIDDPSRDNELDEGSADIDLDRTSGESVTTVPGILVVVLGSTEDPEAPDTVLLTDSNGELGEGVLTGVVVVGDDGDSDIVVVLVST